eukprot:TRINITY_DN2083_c0_g1_i1.p1 TRINITY_DN2083_c0_g1~~TRINITY_DN2083_c0_g1_i1.p1  ORF type:complete len:631 (+),score=96.75 TRINITY_DN2083_c0_g1_i1:241-2133(+)
MIPLTMMMLIIIITLNPTNANYWNIINYEATPTKNHTQWQNYRMLNHPTDAESILIWGGYINAQNNSVQNILWQYNMVSQNWTALTGNHSMTLTESTYNYPGSSKDAGIVIASNNTLVMYGGANSGFWPYNSVWLFNFDTNQWKLLKQGDIGMDMDNWQPGGLSLMSMVMETVDSFLIFGGFSSVGRSNSVWRFNITTKSWTLLKGNATTVYKIAEIEGDDPNPPAMFGSGIVMDSNDSFVIFGGASESDVEESTVWRFTISSRKWEVLSRNRDSTEANYTIPYPSVTSGVRLLLDSDVSFLAIGKINEGAHVWRFSLIDYTWSLVYRGVGYSEVTVGDDIHPGEVFGEDVVMDSLDSFVLLNHVQTNVPNKIWRFQLNRTTTGCWNKSFYSNPYWPVCYLTSETSHPDISSSNGSELNLYTSDFEYSTILENNVVIGSGYDKDDIIVEGGSVKIINQEDSLFVLIQLTNVMAEIVDSSLVTPDFLLNNSVLDITNANITVQSDLVLKDSELVIGSSSYLQVDGCFDADNSSIFVRINGNTPLEEPFLNAVGCYGENLSIEILGNYNDCQSVRQQGSEFSIVFSCYLKNPIAIISVAIASVVVLCLCVFISLYVIRRRTKEIKKKHNSND